MGVAMAAAALASAASGMTVAAPRKAMAYNKLGSSDLMVSSCCLGTGASSKVPEPTAAHAATRRTRSPPVCSMEPVGRASPRGCALVPAQLSGVTTAWPGTSPGSAGVWLLRLLGARLPALGCQA